MDNLGGEALSVPATDWIENQDLVSPYDVAAVEDGWVVLDLAGERIHHLGASGQALAILGGAGQGPGELKYPQALAVEGDTVWVVDARGSRIDGLTLDGAFVRRLEPVWRACAPPRVEDALVAHGELLMSIQCANGGTVRHLVRIDLRTGGVTVEPWPGTNFRRGVLEVGTPRLVQTDANVFASTTFDPCLHSVAPVPPGPCLEAGEWVPLAISERESLSQGLARRARAVGLELEVPDHTGYFNDIFSWQGTLVAARTDSDGATVLVPMSPSFPRTRIPAGITVTLTDHGILLMETVLGGTRLAVVHVQGGQP